MDFDQIRNMQNKFVIEIVNSGDGEDESQIYSDGETLDIQPNLDDIVDSYLEFIEQQQERKQKIKQLKDQQGKQSIEYEILLQLINEQEGRKQKINLQQILLCDNIERANAETDIIIQTNQQLVVNQLNKQASNTRDNLIQFYQKLTNLNQNIQKKELQLLFMWQKFRTNKTNMTRINQQLFGLNTKIINITKSLQQKRSNISQIQSKIIINNHRYIQCKNYIKRHG